METMPHYGRVIERAAREFIPLEVLIELTHRCNFHCAHCYLPDRPAARTLPTVRLLELLEELAGMGTLFLGLSGGELFLRPDWAVIARRARQLGFHLTILTNGSLLDDAAADTLAEIDACVDISLYAAEREVFERVTGRSGSFAATVAGMHRLRERGVNLKLKVPVLQLNLGAHEAAIRLAEDLGLQWSSSPRIVTGRDQSAGPAALRVSHEELVALLSAPRAGCRLGPPESHPAVRGGPLCAAGVRYAVVGPSGEIRACTIMPGSAGNVGALSFRAIWEGSEWFRRLRRVERGDLEECADCARFAYCRRCPAQALVEDGDLLGPSREACRYADAVEKAVDRGA